MINNESSQRRSTRTPRPSPTRRKPGAATWGAGWTSDVRRQTSAGGAGAAALRKLVVRDLDQPVAIDPLRREVGQRTGDLLHGAADGDPEDSLAALEQIDDLLR